MATKEKGVNKKLERLLDGLMDEAIKDHEMSLSDKMKIADRALKMDMMKLKLLEDNMGSGFHQEEDEE